MTPTAAAKVIEFRVITKCKRNFVWAATDYDDLLRQLIEKGYTPTFIMPNEEYVELYENPSIA